MAVITSPIFNFKPSKAVCSSVTREDTSERFAFMSATLADTSPVFEAVSEREVFTPLMFWFEVSSCPFISTSLSVDSDSTEGAVPSYPDSSFRLERTSSFPSLSLNTMSR